MRLDELFFVISILCQILILFVIREAKKKYFLIVLGLGIVILSLLFFWNNAILIDELGLNGSLLSFLFLLLSIFIFILNIWVGTFKNKK